MPTQSARPRFKLAWRVGVPLYETDDAFASLLELFGTHREVVDEVCFFETITHHLYLPLCDLAARAERIGHRLAGLRALGIPSVGVNVLTTIGHLDEARDTMPPLPFQPIVGHDGQLSNGCGCPNSAGLREYIAAKYRLFAAAHPDFIWVDDDLRMHHHGVAWGCFCPTCLALLAEECGQSWTREELVRALDQPERGDLRAAWVERNTRSLESLLALVAQTVRSVDPGVELGLMTAGPAWTTYSGQALDRWFAALGATKARPGGGFYSDAGRLDLLGKAYEVGRQRAALPPTVAESQYELENFPYQRLAKSVSTVLNELTLAAAVGLDGVALNALGGCPTFADSIDIVGALAPHRQVWDHLVRYGEGLATRGLWPAWSQHLTARRRLRAGESWFGFAPRHNITAPQCLAELGLPLSVDGPGDAVLLAGEVCDAFDTAELEALLARGAILDGVALAALQERGLGDLTGVRVANSYDNGLVERFTRVPLNEGLHDLVRDARIEFWGDARGQAVELEPLDESVITLAHLEDYFERPRGACLTLYQNRLGGRVAVMGYAPWMFQRSVAKAWQLWRLAEVVCDGRLPFRFDRIAPVATFARLSADGSRGVVVVLNHSLDTITELRLRLATQPDRVQVVTADGPRLRPPLPDSGGASVLIRDLPAWGTCCLLLG